MQESSRHATAFPHPPLPTPPHTPPPGKTGGPGQKRGAAAESTTRLLLVFPPPPTSSGGGVRCRRLPPGVKSYYRRGRMRGAAVSLPPSPSPTPPSRGAAGRAGLGGRGRGEARGRAAGRNLRDLRVSPGSLCVCVCASGRAGAPGAGPRQGGARRAPAAGTFALGGRRCRRCLRAGTPLRRHLRSGRRTPSRGTAAQPRPRVGGGPGRQPGRRR